MSIYYPVSKLMITRQCFPFTVNKKKFNHLFIFFIGGSNNLIIPLVFGFLENVLPNDF